MSERLRLTPFKPCHEQGFWEMRSDPEVMEYIPLDVATDRESQRRTFTNDLDAGLRFKFGFAVEWPDKPGEAIGWCIARPTEDGRWIELGYWLQRDTWGQGLATELTRRLVTFCVDEKNWPKEDLVATVTLGHQASRHVLEKSGFVVVGDIISYGVNCWYFRQG